MPSQRVVLLLGIGTAVSLLGDSTLYTVLPRLDIASEAGVTLAMVGVLLGANRAIRLLTNGLAGVLYDRFPRRPLLIASLFIGALSTLIFALGRGPAPLLLSRVLWGVAWSGIWVGGNAFVLDVATPHNRGQLSGQYQTWFFLGTGGAALVGGVLTDVIGFRQGLLVSSLLTTLAAVLWLVVLPNMERPAAAHLSTMSGVSTPVPPGPFPWAAALAVSVPLFVSRFVFAGIVAATLALWLTTLVGTGLPLGGFVVPLATLTGALVALRAFVSLVGARQAGGFSDRLGRRWLAVAVAMLMGAAGTWLAGSPATAMAMVGALLAPVTAGGIQAIVPAIVGDRVHHAQRGRMLSVAYTLGDLGSAVGPPLALALVAVLPISTIYHLSSLLLALTVAFALWQSRQERQYGASTQRP
jgi:MFS family permease